MKEHMRYYVTQYDCWWSFSEHQWREWLNASIDSIRSGEGYTLPSERMIHAHPRCAWTEPHGERRWWTSTSATAIVLQPLDWQVDRWEEELRLPHHGITSDSY